MSIPQKIKVKGDIYLAESIAPNKTGEKLEYRGETYVKEEIPAEYVMFEGVAYKRGERIDEYTRKVITEATSKKTPSKIKLKGSDKVFEMVFDKKKD